MSALVQASLKVFPKDARSRGHVDGINPNGAISGWAFLIAAPNEDLKLDLYIHGIFLAQTTTRFTRRGIEKQFGLEQPANIGFSFVLKDFDPKGALELLRRYKRTPPDANLVDDVRVCIAATQTALPIGQKNADVFLDLSNSLDDLVNAAGLYLRQEVADGFDVESLEPADLSLLVRSSPLFSSEWYVETYEEVAISGVDPVEHCQQFAAPFKYDTGPWFDTSAYLEVTPAAQNSRLAPPVHYALHGHDTWWPGQGRFRDVLPQAPQRNDYAVLIHLYHLDTVPDLQRFLTSFPDDVDVFISIPEGSPDHDPVQVAELFPRAREILTVPNRGQDVSAFLETVRHVKERGYKFFCKAHSQKGNIYPDVWRRTMLNALAATPNRVTQTVELFRSNPRVLMSGPTHFLLNEPGLALKNRTQLENMATKLGFGLGIHNNGGAFFAGSCFWIDAGLAELIADTVSTNDFAELTPADIDETAQVMERLFSLAVVNLGGWVALTDGCDWAIGPIVSSNPVEASLSQGKGIEDFLIRHLKGLSSPQIVESTAGLNQTSHADNDPRRIDTALHGTIDVIVSSWTGVPEVLHNGLVELGDQLERNGLTWCPLIGSQPVEDVFLKASCRNVILDSLYLRFPADYIDNAENPENTDLEEDFALSLLRSEALFLKNDLPEGQRLQAAVSHVRKLYCYYRDFLVRHRVKMFLIWGTTAPKSRLFMRLCQELNIEYQIIERGHFPGTLSIDPMGQFGTGARPQLIDQVSPQTALSDEANARFDQIQRWYDTQKDSAAYGRFQKRETKEVEIMRRARQHGRPVILVIGGNDQGGGVTGPDPDPLWVNWFGSSDNAFVILRRLVSAKFPDALLVLRPHPSQRPQEAEFGLVARDAALDDLIENSDLCITVATTASAICLLKEKPLLTLGLSELNGRKVGEQIIDESHLLAALRRHIWSGFANPYPDGTNRNFIIELFDHHLIGVDRSVPTRHEMSDLAKLLIGRNQRMKTGFQQEYIGREEMISQAVFEDARDRGRAIFSVDTLAFTNRTRPGISLVLPIYGDYEGTRICFEQLVQHQKKNGFRVIMVWDRGPDLRLRDLCLEYAEKAGFTYLENSENVGFSGTINWGILHAGSDDVILLNSDTVHCGDWALRLQDAAYAHPKIAAVVPFTNNATIFSVPFPDGTELPEEPVEWVSQSDESAQETAPTVVEMPVAHGFCTYVRRSTFDRIGLYDEMGFGIGQGEDNDFSLRIRNAGFFVGVATGVFVGHAGSTSFGDEIMSWKLAGRKVMNARYPSYMDEVRHFVKNDPADTARSFIKMPTTT